MINGIHGSGINAVASDAPLAAPTEDSGEAAPLLPAPAGEYAGLLGGDAGAELAKLLLDASKQERRLARATRSLAESAQRAAEDAELRAMRDKADQKLAAGMVEGTTKLAAAGVSIVGGARGGSQVLKGSATAVDAHGKLHSTLHERGAELAGIKGTRQEQIAARHKRVVDEAQGELDDAKRLADKAIDFYKEYSTAKEDAKRAAILRA